MRMNKSDIILLPIKQLQNGTHPLFTKEEGASNDGE